MVESLFSTRRVNHDKPMQLQQLRHTLPYVVAVFDNENCATPRRALNGWERVRRIRRNFRFHCIDLRHEARLSRLGVSQLHSSCHCRP